MRDFVNQIKKIDSMTKAVLIFVIIIIIRCPVCVENDLNDGHVTCRKSWQMKPSVFNMAYNSDTAFFYFLKVTSME